MAEGSSALIDFFDPVIQGFDKKGRTFASVLAFDDAQLEAVHDFIQTMFPMPEERGIGLGEVDEKVFYAFHSRPELREQLLRGFVRMLAFYGFEMKFDSSGVEIHPASNYREQFANWLTRWNHNHLRMTRIIRSLRVLSLEKEALAFIKALAKVHWDTHPGIIDPITWTYWKKAAVRPLYADPGRDDEEYGKPFLHQFEEERALEATRQASDLEWT